MSLSGVQNHPLENHCFKLLFPQIKALTECLTGVITHKHVFFFHVENRMPQSVIFVASVSAYNSGSREKMEIKQFLDCTVKILEFICRELEAGVSYIVINRAVPGTQLFIQVVHPPHPTP